MLGKILAVLFWSPNQGYNSYREYLKYLKNCEEEAALNKDKPTMERYKRNPTAYPNWKIEIIEAIVDSGDAIGQLEPYWQEIKTKEILVRKKLDDPETNTPDSAGMGEHLLGGF